MKNKPRPNNIRRVIWLVNHLGGDWKLRLLPRIVFQSIRFLNPHRLKRYRESRNAVSRKRRFELRGRRTRKWPWLSSCRLRLFWLRLSCTSDSSSRPPDNEAHACDAERIEFGRLACRWVAQNAHQRGAQRQRGRRRRRRTDREVSRSVWAQLRLALALPRRQRKRWFRRASPGSCGAWIHQRSARARRRQLAEPERDRGCAMH